MTLPFKHEVTKPGSARLPPADGHWCADSVKVDLGQWVPAPLRSCSCLPTLDECEMPPRRVSAKDSASRTALLDATEEIMLEEGYAAVSSRRVATRAGLDSAVVYYYFGTMDDLFIEVFRRSSERSFQRREEVLASSQPLWGLWEVSQDETDTALLLEFYALANHRKVIRAEISSGSERFRRRQIEMVAKGLKRGRADPEESSPEALVILVNGMANYLHLQISFGNTLGHTKATRMVESLIRRVEGDRLASDDC